MWKKVKGYEGIYEVNESGVVRRVENKLIMATPIHHTGYKVLSLRKPNELRKQFRVHRLVAIAFVPNPKNKPEVNHKDGNKLNNHFSNLEWATTRENKIHSIQIGLVNPFGENNNSSKLTDKEVEEIKQHPKYYGSRKYLSEKYNISYSRIGQILRT